MRLLLNAMYPAAVAEALRESGHDVLAAQEDEDLRRLNDASLFRLAQELGRAVVTENVKDFAPLAADTVARGDAHHGLLFTSNRAFPRHRQRFIGALVRSLERFLEEHPEDDPRGLVAWLDPASG